MIELGIYIENVFAQLLWTAIDAHQADSEHCDRGPRDLKDMMICRQRARWVETLDQRIDRSNALPIVHSWYAMPHASLFPPISWRLDLTTVHNASNPMVN